MTITEKWSPEWAFAHLSETFALVGKQFPALFELYEILLADAHDDAARVEIMRRGLRETLAGRYSLHEKAAAE